MNSGDNDDEIPEEAAIETRGLHMRYGSTEVLRGVDLRVRRGEVVALLGPNGAGKTTTIEILEGFRGRSAGEVRVLGTDPGHGDEAWRARLGIVLQSWRDHGKWRVRELLDHLGRYYVPYSTPSRRRPYDTDELIALVGLTGREDAVAGRLSGGQRRRLDVAIGLVGRPDLLFLDEPTVGFDPQARQDFHELVRRLADLEDTTILLTTHDLDEAEKLAHRILILAGGTIVADGTAAELARRVTGRAEVRYSRDGEFHTESVEDATGYVRGLFARYGDAIGDLEVRRVRLEDVYLAMVRDFEAGRHTGIPGELAEVSA
ncbi:multidrug ABC transporter ATP-binding protein [Sphaerisporangium melleum]|uniref:Multidrug ABC transporter ATP-binding protein n=1 Tax=Sphaerisporangium melleum TaxID=321316 RepID=A0A917VJG8_9ACTN|nr:ABC transporter ATP-binding protein [Sphaerisporangium melleum]GGK90995.1 multidrug ABC transporter ATP-binding protein [Sphaerisporangium melleum]GII72794.1 multidrug ABC transporter ATP-binding protein [Sphaerisporangium melleum]